MINLLLLKNLASQRQKILLARLKQAKLPTSADLANAEQRAIEDKMKKNKRQTT